MVKGYSDGKMDPLMKETTKMTKNTVSENTSTRRVKVLRDSGDKALGMVKV